MVNDYGLVRRNRHPLPPKEELQAIVDLGLQMGGVTVEEDNRNPRIPAGFTFFGQLLGHDITHDAGLSFEENDEGREGFRNHRTPALDLDCLYGAGPEGSREIFDANQHGRFGIDHNAFDLPRDAEGKAIIADSRNDRNLMLAQLHLAFLRFHNAALEHIEKINDGVVTNLGSFEKTRRLVQWHYQWIVLREFLPLLVGPQLMLELLTEKLKWYKANEADFIIPLEFSVAAYRFGHSQVLSLYRINDDFRLPLFSTKQEVRGERQDLRGGPVEEKYAINWKNFFHTGVEPTPLWKRGSKRITARLAGPLLFPPPSVTEERAEESKSLREKGVAVRDLERGQGRGLPSGQEVANEMNKWGNVAVLGTKKKAFDEALEPLPEKLRHDTPLWYYILKEAEVQYKGEMLGDVGGRIVAEVIIGLLQADRSSLWEKVDLVHLCTRLQEAPELQYHYENAVPQAVLKPMQSEARSWKPALPSTTAGDFTIVDLLKYARVKTQ